MNGSGRRHICRGENAREKASREVQSLPPFFCSFLVLRRAPLATTTAGIRDSLCSLLFCAEHSRRPFCFLFSCAAWIDGHSAFRTSRISQVWRRYSKIRFGFLSTPFSWRCCLPLRAARFVRCPGSLAKRPPLFPLIFFGLRPFLLAEMRAPQVMVFTFFCVHVLHGSPLFPLSPLRSPSSLTFDGHTLKQLQM